MLTRLHARPFHLGFGWGDLPGHGPSPAGDGTITLESQLDPRVQEVATAISGFEGTHVGSLSAPKALRALARALASATAAKP